MLRGIGSALVALLLAADLTTPSVAPDVPHRLHVEPYDGGRQIKIIVGFIITMAECRHLIAAYVCAPRAGR